MKISFCSLMKAVSLSLALVGMFSLGQANADDVPAEPARVHPASTAPVAAAPVISAGEIAATPEMWFYEQALQRYDDPKNAIRAVAEQKAAQRRARLAAQQWYGYSNLRPTAGIDPVHGLLQPQWIGNGYNPYSWTVPSGPANIWMIPGITGAY